MEKIYGTKKRQDCLVRTGRSKWILFYGFGKDDENSENGWEWKIQCKLPPKTKRFCPLVLK